MARTFYKEQSERWSRHLQWLRSILCYRPILWRSRVPRLVHRDRRETLLAFAREVAPTAEPARLRHLVGLAKREVLRDRHRTTLGLLVSNDGRGREFMAQFIFKHDGPDVLAPEFQPLDVRQSARWERLKAAMVIDAQDEPAREVRAQQETCNQHLETVKVSIPNVDPRSETSPALLAPSTNPEPLPTLDELAEFYSEWLLAELHPMSWDAITKQTRLEIWRPFKEHKRAAASNAIVSNGAKFRPSCVGSDGFDMNNLYADWGARWLVTKNPNPDTVSKACQEGLRIAGEKWDRKDR
jgi:hypothetical protein